jgi:uncharacterized membrane protein YdjX (TVP38/TMEM64 family)
VSSHGILTRANFRDRPKADASTVASYKTLNSAITVQTMKYFLITASGTVVGTFLYTGFFSSAHEPHWGRVAFLGVFRGVCSAVWPKKKGI